MYRNKNLVSALSIEHQINTPGIVLSSESMRRTRNAFKVFTEKRKDRALK